MSYMCGTGDTLANKRKLRTLYASYSIRELEAALPLWRTPAGVWSYNVCRAAIIRATLRRQAHV